jgi:hypothetical protein
MGIQIHRNDLIVLAVFIFIVVAAAAYGVSDSRSIRQSLESVAQEKVDDWFQGADRTKFEYVTIIEPSKAFLIFGRAWGVVHIFIREKGDEEMKTFKGLEYYCKRSNGQWAVQDSAGCGALEHHVKAFRKMEELGMKVSPKVYEKLNRN